MKDSSEFTDLGPVDQFNPDGVMDEDPVNGTKIDKVFTNDWFQTLMKCKRDSGTVPNGEFDDSDKGYQLFQAMFGTPWKEVGNDGGATTFLNGATSSTGPYTGGKTLRYRKTRGGSYVHIEGWIGLFSVPDDNTLFTLPIGYRPDQSVRSNLTTNDGSQYDFSLLSTGEFSTAVFGVGSAYINIELPLP